MTFGAEIWGPPLIGAATGWLTGASSTPKETKTQKMQRKLVDRLLNSLNGQGEFSDLFNADEGAFQRSFVEPAQALFRNQIAPQIQQQYIASGQQRGTGLDDQLLRAGVDLDAMLNEKYYQFQQDALNRKQGVINTALGQPAGAPNEPSTMDNILSGVSGALSSPSTARNIFDAVRGYGQQSQMGNTTAPKTLPPRKGFAPDWLDYRLGDNRFGGYNG